MNVMKKISKLLFLILLGSNTLYAQCPHFHSVFHALGIKVENTIDDMNRYAQNNFLRKPDEERWQMAQSKYEKKRHKLIPALKGLGLYQKVVPRVGAKYDYAVVLGATVPSMRKRLFFLQEAFERYNVTFDSVVFLVGQRPLSPEVEDENTIFCPKDGSIRKDWVKPQKLTVKTETDGAKLAWDQVITNKKLKEIPIIFVDTPMSAEGKGPTTGDTVKAWMGLNVKPGAVIAFSSNPHVPYQDMVLRNLLVEYGWFKKGGKLKTIGSAVDEDAKVGVMLDAFARYLFEYKKHTQSFKK